jgi:hypothetical protein
MAVRLSVLRTDRAELLRNIICMLLVLIYIYGKCVKDKNVHTDSWLDRDLSSERAPHRDRATNSILKLLKRKNYLVKRPQSWLDPDWLTISSKVTLTLWWPPLWSSGQSSWLQILRSGLDSRRYHIFWEVVGLERGPLSVVSTIEELLERKISGSGLEIQDYGLRKSAALTTQYPFIRKTIWHYLRR